MITARSCVEVWEIVIVRGRVFRGPDFHFEFWRALLTESTNFEKVGLVRLVRSKEAAKQQNGVETTDFFHERPDSFHSQTPTHSGSLKSCAKSA